MIGSSGCAQGCQPETHAGQRVWVARRALVARRVLVEVDSYGLTGEFD